MLYTLAMPPWDLTPLAWVALVPFVGCPAWPGATARRARGVAWGTAVIWGIGHWVPVALVICFEAIFPDLVRARMARGARVLVVLSNDIWLGNNAGPRQHLSMARLRAVENRTWVVRATTTGVSAIIDPFGRIRAQSGLFTSAVLDAAVVPLQIGTVYKRFGDWFAWVCVVVSAGAALLAGRRR